ncbi:hypothetical protein A9Q99_09860 [Gammaproteobacteria bacterium 45_16_T64]|nr:hypothetical protein A9Q99_09860 [Gammaproteobacteria bacterium 45_16_T64]
MTRLLIAIAFLLGASAIIWMGMGFVGSGIVESDIVALSVTLVIGLVYSIGFIELIQFQRATATLSAALSGLPEKVESLSQWLVKLHPSLQNAARLRIEGERVGLPAPVLTPYLVGLLVMLGLLGTFAGMVDTLKGAVVALEGSTELEAIREGLAAPIQGLGIAFGTSVAGVAASAMLGLMSTLSRRERMLATRQLDSHIGKEFREFSLLHNRQETFKAMQVQAHALPEVAEKLNLMTDQLQRMSENLGETLIANQATFHDEVKGVYSDLATSVGHSLKESLAESGRLAGDSIKPIVKDAMAEISEEIRSGAKQTHQQLTSTVQGQLEAISARFSLSTDEVTQAWKEGLDAHNQANDSLLGGMTNSLESMSTRLEQSATSILASFETSVSESIEVQALGDKDRLTRWADVIEQSQQHTAAELQQVSDRQVASLKTATDNFESMSVSLNSDWRSAGEHTLTQQQKITDVLVTTANDIVGNAQSNSSELLTEMTRLLAASETLVQARMDSEQSWLDNHGERMDSLTTTLKAELTSLREDEAQRSESAVQRLSGLEMAITQSWKEGLKAHENANSTLIGGMDTSLNAMSERLEESASSILASLDNTVSDNIQQQTLSDEARLDRWSGVMESSHQKNSDRLSEITRTYTGELKGVTEVQQASFGTATEKLVSMSEAMGADWRDAGEKTIAQQQKITDTLTATAGGIVGNAESNATQLLTEMTRLLTSSENLVNARIETEQSWLEKHGDKMDNLTATLRAELSSLRDEEERRGNNAVDRLSELETTVTTHLSTLGQALEAPMTSLIQTASETPKAAAEVIDHLRREISNNIERDNGLLEERSRIMGELDNLSQSLEKASSGQREAVERLIQSSASVLNDVGAQFTDHIGNETTKLTEIADHFAGSATEMSSLGEAFGFAVNLFSESNNALIENLTRIEESLDKSSSRSDEQLAYYVAQAREIIDHNVMSQKDIFEELRQLGQTAEPATEEVS